MASEEHMAVSLEKFGECKGLELFGLRRGADTAFLAGRQRSIGGRGPRLMSSLFRKPELPNVIFSPRPAEWATIMPGKSYKLAAVKIIPFNMAFPGEKLCSFLFRSILISGTKPAPASSLHSRLWVNLACLTPTHVIHFLFFQNETKNNPEWERCSLTVRIESMPCRTAEKQLLKVFFLVPSFLSGFFEHFRDAFQPLPDATLLELLESNSGGFLVGRDFRLAAIRTWKRCVRTGSPRCGQVLLVFEGLSRAGWWIIGKKNGSALTSFRDGNSLMNAEFISSLLAVPCATFCGKGVRAMNGQGKSRTVYHN